MNTLPKRLLELVLVLAGLAAIAMLVGFSTTAGSAIVPQHLSGDELFYPVLGVFDAAVLVWLAKLARQ